MSVNIQYSLPSFPVADSLDYRTQLLYLLSHEYTHALNSIKIVYTCVYWLLQNNEFYQIGMRLIYLNKLNFKYFQPLKWYTCCNKFIDYNCNVLQFEIEIFDLDTTTVHAGCSKLIPLKNHITNKTGGSWKSLHNRFTLIHIGHRNYLNCPNQNRNNWCKVLKFIVLLTWVGITFVLF